MKKYVLFLNNKYLGKDNAFYLKMLRSKISVAVDGGIRFFLKNRIRPDILIGDLDSAPGLTAKYLADLDVIRYPVKKDKTDVQLAVELVLRRGAGRIEICGALGATEIDHTLGNILILDWVNDYNRENNSNVTAVLAEPRETVWLVDNSSTILTGKKGDYLSVIPLTDKIRVDFDGLVYPPPKRALKFGDSLTLRNEFKKRKCHLTVRGGKAIIAVISKR